MKQTTMCLLSGFFGALFAVACGIVDGVGDKVANADGGLTRSVYEIDCADGVELLGLTEEGYEYTTGYEINIGRTVSTNASVTSWYFDAEDGKWLVMSLLNALRNDGTVTCSAPQYEDGQILKFVIIE